MIISIDPGVRSLAYAVWHEGELLRWSYEKFKTFDQLALVVQRMPRYGVMVIEKPQLYYGARRDIDPGDIVNLARTVGACYSLSPVIQEYLPAQWKKQLPKKICHMRILAKLRFGELDTLGKGIKNHNVIDAVGIGLHYLGR